GATRDLSQALLTTLPESTEVALNGEQYAIRLLLRHGDVAIYTLASIDASIAPIWRDTIRALVLITLCSLAVAALASMWLSYTVARPINTLSSSLSALTTSRRFDTPVSRTGSSLEVDTLTNTFNTLMATVAQAEADTR